jgi:hypothetical protein
VRFCMIEMQASDELLLWPLVHPVFKQFDSVWNYIQTLRHRMNRCCVVGSSDGVFSLCLPLRSSDECNNGGISSYDATLWILTRPIIFEFFRFVCFHCVPMSTLRCFTSEELESAYILGHLLYGQATGVWTPLNCTEHYKLANPCVLHLPVTLGTNNVLSLVVFVYWSSIISNWGVQFH